MILPRLGEVARACLRSCLPLTLAFAPLVHAVLPAPERVTLPSLEHTAAGEGVMITALLFRPPAAGNRVPLVIALHGCGGMYGRRDGGEAQLTTRFARWTDLMLADGYAVLWPDSFNPRGRREVCTIRSGERTINAAMRRLDVLGALTFAGQLPEIDVARIALVGWSHGGSTTLATINGANARVAAYRSQADAAPWLRAAVAFYPGCAAALKAGASWQPAAPLAIHIGELDDWTPAAPCVALGQAMRERGAAVTVDVYPDSYHGFDSPAGRVVLRRDVPNGVRPGEGVHVGPNPASRGLVTERVREYLGRQLAVRVDSSTSATKPTTSSKDKP